MVNAADVFHRQTKADLFTVLDKFVEHAALLDNLYVSPYFEERIADPLV